MVNAIDQINGSISFDFIAQVVREELGEEIMAGFANASYATMMQALRGYNLSIVAAAKQRVDFLIGRAS